MSPYNQKVLEKIQVVGGVLPEESTPPIAETSKSLDTPNLKIQQMFKRKIKNAT